MAISNKIFVYGTLIDPSSSEEARLLFHKGKIVEQGFFYGKLLHTGEYPAAIISKDVRDKVHGLVIELPSPEIQDILQLLDDYEECSPSFSEPTLYRRELLTVFSEEGKPYKAWVYLYNRPASRLRRLSGDFYIKQLQKLRAKFTH